MQGLSLIKSTTAVLASAILWAKFFIKSKYSGNILIIAFITFFSINELFNQQKSNVFLVDYVNPLMGTDSKKSLSNGNTYPAIATPFGMNFWTPMTAEMGNGWTYNYNDNKIRGIKQTHQPSPWLNDYAAFSLMAVTGHLKFQEDDR